MSSRLPGETREFDRFSEPLKEIIDARIWGVCISALPTCRILGRKVVHYMAKHYFEPLD